MTQSISLLPEAGVLAVNAGSSSIKFAIYSATLPPRLRMRGKIDRIGLPNSTLIVNDSAGAEMNRDSLAATDFGSAASALLDWLQQTNALSTLTAIGHRVVHGGSRYEAPTVIDDALVQELRRICAYSPEHLPGEIELMERFRSRLPDIRQVACFDTAFHRDIPRVAQLLPLPRRLDAQGIRRFGFHGLSYAFLMEELERIAGREVAQGRVILAHLGNGTSLAAVREGKSMDTTMAFTPAAGVPMSTRSGDLDPGLGWYLAQTQDMSAEQFHHMVNHESGLLGVSQTSSDMRDLLALESTDVRAAEAVALYCYQVAKSIGAFAVVLGGLDTLIFAGGIGENAPLIRERICARLAVLGVALSESGNAANESVISINEALVTVRVIRTDEEATLVRATCRTLAGL